MEPFDFVNRANAEFIDRLWEQYRKDPRSVSEQWQAFFDVEQPLTASADTNSTAIDHSLIVRSTGIRPEVPNNLSRRFRSSASYALARALGMRLARKITWLRQFRNHSNPTVQTGVQTIVARYD